LFVPSTVRLSICLVFHSARCLPNISRNAGVERRVAEREEDDLGVGVGQRAERDFPHLRVNAAGLVEDQDDALALIVQAGERLGVVADQVLRSARHWQRRGRARC
jgi:hypothetical protein